MIPTNLEGQSEGERIQIAGGDIVPARDDLIHRNGQVVPGCGVCGLEFGIGMPGN